MGRPSRFVFVDISGTARWFYIRLSMRVYPGGIILCLDFRVTGSKVKGHRLFFCFVDISRTVGWICIKLCMRVYPGEMILYLDFKVTGSKVKGHSLFCEKGVLLQYFTYYETYDLMLGWSITRQICID